MNFALFVVLFWDAIKVLGNNLSFLDLTFLFFRQKQRGAHSNNFLVLGQDLSWIMTFSILASRNGNHSQACVNARNCSLNPFGCLFSQCWIVSSSHACTDAHSVECSWGTLHISLRFFSVQLSHFQYSAPPIIPSLESPLYLFNSGRPLDSFGVTSFLCHHLETFSIREAIAMIGLTHFSPFSQKRLSSVHCLKNHYFMYFVFFGGEGVSGKG